MEKLANSMHIPGQYHKIGTKYFGKGTMRIILKLEPIGLSLARRVKGKAQGTTRTGSITRSKKLFINDFQWYICIFELTLQLYIKIC